MSVDMILLSLTIILLIVSGYIIFFLIPRK
jgi:hypothetical protein